jgi:hypothetical protein
MSTELITYLNYMSTWDTESDENIKKIITEQQLFASLGDFPSDAAVDAEFGVLTDLATTLRDATVGADATQIAADAAAVAAIWSFGLSMAVFAVLEAGEAIEKKVISNKSAELNGKLKTVDTDISARINPNVNLYVMKYKENNDLIMSKAAKGMDTRSCRSVLMQFMAQVHRNDKSLTVDGFKKYAESARKLYNSTEISGVYDALDKLNMSAKSDADVQHYMGFIQGLNFSSTTMTIVKQVSFAIMLYKLNIANKTIKECAKAAGLEVAEVEQSAFGMLDACGKFAVGVTAVMSVVDTMLQIIDMVDVVEQTKTSVDALNGSIKTNYKAYFNGIKEASKQYNAAIAEAEKA